MRAIIEQPCAKKTTGARHPGGGEPPKAWLVFILSVAFFGGPLVTAASAAATMIYQTGFEVTEGYATNLDLVGQKGWQGAGSGGNGVVSGLFPGKGQQAYVGFTPPATNDASLFLYHPIDKNLPQVQFSVTMAILDSTTTNRDDFYWSVYNEQGQPLFTLDFDNYDLRCYYYLDNTNGPTWSGVTFTNGGAYQLRVAMDFTSNRWSATLGGAALATNQPLTTAGAALNLGDVDAAWVVFDPKAPGDNFMVFDDYLISATAPAPQLAVVAMSNGVPNLRVTGLADSHFAVEASADLVSWLPLSTNVAAGGSFDYAGDSAVGLPQRFYRARWVPW